MKYKKQPKRYVIINDSEWRLLVAYLNTVRSKYIDEGKPIEDVNVLSFKAMNAKLKKARI